MTEDVAKVLKISLIQTAVPTLRCAGTSQSSDTPVSKNWALHIKVVMAILPELVKASALAATGIGSAEVNEEGQHGV